MIFFFLMSLKKNIFIIDYQPNGLFNQPKWILRLKVKYKNTILLPIMKLNKNVSSII